MLSSCRICKSSKKLSVLNVTYWVCIMLRYAYKTIWVNPKPTNLNKWVRPFNPKILIMCQNLTTLRLLIYIFSSLYEHFFFSFDAVLLWLLTAACIKTGRPQIARRAIELAESRLSKDHWPEYYDGKLGRYVGKQARKFQTWSIAGYLAAKMMLDDPSHLGMITLEEDKQMKPPLKRSASWTV